VSFCHSGKFLPPAGGNEIYPESTITDCFMKKQIVNGKVKPQRWIPDIFSSTPLQKKFWDNKS